MKYASKEVWNLRDSLRRAKARATDYYERLRGLEIKVRDLERSREAWKKNFQQATEELKSNQPRKFDPEPEGFSPTT